MAPFVLDPSTVPRWPAMVWGCLDLCHQNSGADLSRPIGTTAALPQGKRKILPLLAVAQTCTVPVKIRTVLHMFLTANLS